jgi:hypothetical protein
VLHDDADKAEPRVKRAVLKAASRARRGLDLGKLAEALERRDLNAAVAHANEAIGDVWKPLGEILKDARMKGHKRGRAAVVPQGDMT